MIEKPFVKREFIKDLPIAAEWNDEQPIKKFRAGSEYVAQWKCVEGHVWKQSITTRTGKNRTKCPYCNNRKVWTGFNDLASQYPHLLEEWNDEKDPSTVLATGSYKAQWKCKEYGHEWKAELHGRTIQKNNCPYCGNRKLLEGFNDFATRFPEIAAEWHPTKNDIVPNSFIMNGKIKYWWICDLGHSYQMTCKARSERKFNCSICAGKSILEGFNDLASQRPELVKDWMYNKNTLDPTKISIHRNEKVWWKCHICSHEWKALIGNRSRGIGCPQCSGAISKQEKTLLAFIKTLLPSNIEIIENDKTVIKPKEIDIYLPELKLGFEYNGIYWHNKNEYLKDLKNNTIKSPEMIKTWLAGEKDVRIIHIWSDEWLNERADTEATVRNALIEKMI